MAEDESMGNNGVDCSLRSLVFALDLRLYNPYCSFDGPQPSPPVVLIRKPESQPN